MRLFLLIVLFFLNIRVYSQDKIYLIDNSVIEGTIVSHTNKNIELLTSDGAHLTIAKKNIATILNPSGEPIAFRSENSNSEMKKLSEWMTGMNFLMPLDGYAGIMIEKNISKRYSVRVGQSFNLNNYFRFQSTTSVLNNFYFGRSRVKLIMDIGFNLYYFENGNNYNENLYGYDDFAPYPQYPHNSGIDLGITFGVGMFINLTKRLAFSTQLNITSYLFDFDFESDLDLPNTGFLLFYKF